MHSMGHTIEVVGISDDLLSKLDERASQIGVDRSSYVRRLIERAVSPPSTAGTLGELLAPVHDYTEARSISEIEIEELFSRALAESRRTRRGSESGDQTTC